MKKIIILFIGVAFLASCKGVFDKVDPVKYNDDIIGENEKIEAVFTDFFYALEDYNFEEAEALRLKSILVSDSAIARIGKLGTFKGKDDFRQAAIKYIEIGKKLAETDFKKLVDIYKGMSVLEDDESDDSYEKYDVLSTEMEQIYANMNTVDSTYFQKFHTAQKQFAKDNNITLEVQPKDSEIDKQSLEELLKQSKQELEDGVEEIN
jgi:hypothetical protein